MEKKRTAGDDGGVGGGMAVAAMVWEGLPVRVHHIPCQRSRHAAASHSRRAKSSLPRCLFYFYCILFFILTLFL